MKSKVADLTFKPKRANHLPPPHTMGPAASPSQPQKNHLSLPPHSPLTCVYFYNLGSVGFPSIDRNVHCMSKVACLFLFITRTVTIRVSILIIWTLLIV